MRPETIENLTRTYMASTHKTSASCLKFHYEYNSVHVNVYFDAFDIQSLSLSIVLMYNQEIYFTSLNIVNNEIENRYLPNLTYEIKNHILVDNRLDDFYNNMEEHLSNDTPYCNYGYDDKYFRRGVSNASNANALVFWSHIRRVRMTDQTLNQLYTQNNISYETLLAIQNNGLTLVRTADPTRRKKLTLILKKFNIELQ